VVQVVLVVLVLQEEEAELMEVLAVVLVLQEALVLQEQVIHLLYLPLKVTMVETHIVRIILILLVGAEVEQLLLEEMEHHQMQEMVEMEQLLV
jgi:hypothetical protein